MRQEGLYTCGIAANVVTLTPKAGTASNPNHLANATVVVTTVAAAAPPDFWKTTDEYEVVVRSRTKS